jgi:hypothetical protein
VVNQAVGKQQLLMPGPIHKFYIAQVFAALAFMFGLASIASYGVSAGFIEPSHIRPYISLWWGALYLISIVNLFFCSYFSEMEGRTITRISNERREVVLCDSLFNLFRNIIA